MPILDFIHLLPLMTFNTANQVYLNQKNMTH